MKRRKFLAYASAAALAPLAAAAQSSGKVHRIAILDSLSPVADIAETRSPLWRAFFAELRRLGYVEGRNLVAERRSAEGDVTRLPALAREVVALRPDVIFATTYFSVEALKAATTTIPVVAYSWDPVGSGFAQSLARPGGNITGFSADAGLVEIWQKVIELLKQAVPAMSRMAYLAPRVILESKFGEIFKVVATRAGLTPVDAPLDPPFGEAEYRRAFAAVVRDRVDSVYVSSAAANYAHRRLIADLAGAAGLPAIYVYREYVEAGGLMAYAIDLSDIWRRAATYIDQILKGANPAEMPIQQPTKYELVINMKTAKALGLAIPPSLLGIADEVIE